MLRLFIQTTNYSVAVACPWFRLQPLTQVAIKISCQKIIEIGGWGLRRPYNQKYSSFLPEWLRQHNQIWWI